MAVGKTTAQAFINFIEHGIICQFGHPEHLVTDKGSVMMLQEFAGFLNCHRIWHLSETTYHQQTNYLVERMAQTNKMMLWQQILNGNDQSEWAVPFQRCILGHNTSVQETMKETFF